MGSDQSAVPDCRVGPRQNQDAGSMVSLPGPAVNNYHLCGEPGNRPQKHGLLLSHSSLICDMLAPHLVHVVGIGFGWEGSAVAPYPISVHKQEGGWIVHISHTVSWVPLLSVHSKLHFLTFCFSQKSCSASSRRQCPQGLPIRPYPLKMPLPLNIGIPGSQFPP